MKHLNLRAATLFVVIVSLLFLVGCETVDISKVLSDPSRYSNKTVRVKGVVENSMGAMGHGAYAVSDGTGTIWVISNKGVPSRGARIGVEGTVFQGAQVFGRSIGVAIREKKHKLE